MATTLLRPREAPTAPAAAPPARGRWERPALLVLLAATAVLYLWGLGESGWANSFYSAAAQAGSQSWKAFFYGSSDAANSITVDKTPASLWVMALSVRVFGLSTWSILVPQALMGVGSVGLLHATVKRWSGPAAGLLAGAVLALTPVAVLMFRFNNPDALLVLLLIAAAYATVRATEHTGSIPSAGPAVAGGMGGPGGGRGGQAPQGGTGGAPGGTGTGGPGGAGAAPGGTGTGGPGGAGGGGMSGLLNGSTASSELVALLRANADDYTWAAATVGSNNASGYQLASGEPVMAIGGFNGTDPSPTLEQFTAYVSAAKIHYFVSSGTRAGGSAAAQEIAAWVAQNYQATTVGGVTVYDLTG